VRERLPGAESKARTAAACLIGPLPTPVVITVAFALEKPELGWSLKALFGYTLFMRMMTLPVAYLVEFVLGWPLFRLYLLLGWRSVTAFAIGGAAIGALAGAFFVTGVSHKPSELCWLTGCVVSGALSASLFRAVLRVS